MADTAQMARDMIRALNSGNTRELIRVINLLDITSVGFGGCEQISRMLIICARDYGRHLNPGRTPPALDEALGKAIARALIRLGKRHRILEYMDDKEFRTVGFGNLKRLYDVAQKESGRQLR